MRALGSELAGLPRLCSLDLRRTASWRVSPHDVTVSVVAACIALTKLNLSECKLAAGRDSVRTLCSIHARLLDLTLSENRQLGSDGVGDILAAPLLLGLTRLSLVHVGIKAGPWPWRQLCGLTALQDLLLHGNEFGDAGAGALASHVAALVQLQRLDISCCNLTISGALGRVLCRLPRLVTLTCGQWEPMLEPFEVPTGVRANGFEMVSRS